MPVDLSFSGTYPRDERFWVSEEAASEYPLRYGDVFTTPEDDAYRDSRGRPWRAVMALHPSCEMGDKPAPQGVQVVRVHLLREVSTSQRDEVRTGFVEQAGQVRIARANMVYLAPVAGVGADGDELYADLRASARVPLDTLRGHRLAAMSHEARVAVLRRDLYFRYRWLLPLDDVAELERGRISADRAFVGPRPPWAP